MTRTRSAFRAPRANRTLHGLVMLGVLASLGSLSCGGSAGKTAPPMKDDTAPTLAADEVRAIMEHAALAIKGRDYGVPLEAAIAVTDRRGVVLGVATTFDFDYAGECAVGDCPAPGFPAVGTEASDCTVVDLALQLARTPSFFSADQTPLTSRSVRFLSGEHFPDRVKNTASAALFGIENTNRGCSFDDVRDPAEGDIPRARSLPAVLHDRGIVAGDPLLCESSDDPMAKCGCTTGIATLPGGVPIYKNGRMVGGIGVALFPTTESSLLYQPDPVAAFDFVNNVLVNDILRREDRNELYTIGEFAARAYAGDAVGLPVVRGQDLENVCDANGAIPRPACCSALTPCFFNLLPLPPGTRPPFDPVIFIDGIEIPEVAQDPAIPRPGTGFTGLQNFIVDPADIDENDPTESGRPVLTDWLVNPTDATDGATVPDPLTADEVNDIIIAGRDEALKIRGGIRLPLEARTAMMLAVSDTNGVLLGLFRMDDATVFSIDVSVAKSRNVIWFSNPAINPIDTADCPSPNIDQCGPPGAIPAGTAVTNRTLSFAAQPFFPSGIDGRPPGPYRRTFVEDSANPCTNGREPANGRQNGIVFFPGSTPLYKNGVLVGGFGVSGDGVEQDDIVTTAGATKAVDSEPVTGHPTNYFPDPDIRADQVFVRGVRLPYVKFNRAPDQ